MYVVDKSNHRVQVLNSDLTFSSTFGKKGSGKGQFSYPRGIACDSTGSVYVADTHNNRIKVFTAEGKFLRMFSGCYSKELCLPYSVAVDTSGMVYFSENGTQCIFVVTSEGQFVESFGGVGKGPGEFLCPRGLAVDNSGIVYVYDFNNNRVQMF